MGWNTGKQTNALGKLLMTWGVCKLANSRSFHLFTGCFLQIVAWRIPKTASTGVHQQNNLTFSVSPPARAYFISVVDVIVAAASEVDSGVRPSSPQCPAGSCRSSLKLGFVVSTRELFHSSLHYHRCS